MEYTLNDNHAGPSYGLIACVDLCPACGNNVSGTRIVFEARFLK